MRFMRELKMGHGLALEENLSRTVWKYLAASMGLLNSKYVWPI